MVKCLIVGGILSMRRTMSIATGPQRDVQDSAKKSRLGFPRNQTNAIQLVPRIIIFVVTTLQLSPARRVKISRARSHAQTPSHGEALKQENAMKHAGRTITFAVHQPSISQRRVHRLLQSRRPISEVANQMVVAKRPRSSSSKQWHHT